MLVFSLVTSSIILDVFIFSDLTLTSLDLWLVRGIISKWPCDNNNIQQLCSTRYNGILSMVHRWLIVIHNCIFVGEDHQTRCLWTNDEWLNDWFWWQTNMTWWTSRASKLAIDHMESVSDHLYSGVLMAQWKVPEKKWHSNGHVSIIVVFPCHVWL